MPNATPGDSSPGDSSEEQVLRLTAKDDNYIGKIIF